MPESVRDRPVRSFEDIFFLTKNQDYYYNIDAGEPLAGSRKP